MPFIGYTAYYVMSHIRIDLRVMALIMLANVYGLAIEVANDLISPYHSVTKCLTQNCIWHRGMLGKIYTYWHSSICWIFTDWKVDVSRVRQWVMHFSNSDVFVIDILDIPAQLPIHGRYSCLLLTKEYEELCSECSV